MELKYTTCTVNELCIFCHFYVLQHFSHKFFCECLISFDVIGQFSFCWQLQCLAFFDGVFRRISLLCAFIFLLMLDMQE